MLESDPETLLSEIDISHIDLWKQDKKWGFQKDEMKLLYIIVAVSTVLLVCYSV